MVTVSEPEDILEPHREVFNVQLSNFAQDLLPRQVESYRVRLLATARSIANDDVIEKGHLLRAAKDLRPYKATLRSLAQDWLKRIGLALLAAFIPLLVIELSNGAPRPAQTVGLFVGATAGLIVTLWAIIGDVIDAMNLRQEKRLDDAV